MKSTVAIVSTLLVTTFGFSSVVTANEGVQLNRTALEVLDTHAKNLETEFSTFEEFQDLFIDVFGQNLGSPNNLANLQNQFIDGTLRPEVKFVSSEALTDAQGITRGAAFDQQSQTILLSEDLDAAGIESSIEQEIGHWWDVQLNGDEDTTTPDGQAYDEGTAYAERFSEGANGDNIFSDLVYQNDFQTIPVNGQETEIEFRNIATWNINGNRNQDNNTLQVVLETMENPGQDQAPIEIMGIQEVSSRTLTEVLREATEIDDLQPNTISINEDNYIGSPLLEYNFQFNNNNYQLFANFDGGGSELRGTAIILRNPPDEVRPISGVNPVSQRSRGYLGVQTPQGYYFTVHAQAQFGGGPNQNNDAQPLIQNITELVRQNLDPDRERELYILGDFNRNIAAGGFPNNGIGIAYPEAQQNGDQRPLNELVIPLDNFTFSAREGNATSTLDYMFTDAALANRGGTVLDQLPNANTAGFPSDHFPVVYDDEVVGMDDDEPTNIDGGTATLTRFRENLQSPIGEPVTENIVRGETEFSPQQTTLRDPNDFIPVVPDIGFLDPIFDIEFFSGNPIKRFSGDPDEADRFRISFVDRTEGLVTIVGGEFTGYELSLENLPPIESVILDDSTNSLGVADNDIELVDQNTIRVNLEGISAGSIDFPSNPRGFDLLVDFDTDGFCPIQNQQKC